MLRFRLSLLDFDFFLDVVALVLHHLLLLLLLHLLLLLLFFGTGLSTNYFMVLSMHLILFIIASVHFIVTRFTFRLLLLSTLAPSGSPLLVGIHTQVYFIVVYFFTTVFLALRVLAVALTVRHSSTGWVEN